MARHARWGRGFCRVHRLAIATLTRVRAVIFSEFGVRPEVREAPDPEPAPDGVVIEVEATGVCRSDWSADVVSSCRDRLPVQAQVTHALGAGVIPGHARRAADDARAGARPAGQLPIDAYRLHWRLGKALNSGWVQNSSTWLTIGPAKTSSTGPSPNT